jgi:hypothetical protein
MRTRLLIVLLATLLLGIGQAQAAVILFETTLAPEIAGSIGHGDALVTVDTTAHTLEVSTTFSDLTGPTTVAHIHCCVDPPGTVGVATYPSTFPGFPAGVTSGSYASPTPIDLTLASSFTSGFVTTFGGGTIPGAEAALLAGLLAGRAYLNIHTSFSPGGEIRGFLAPVAVPEPATLVLLGLAGGAAFARRRRQRRIVRTA